ncbi:MAG: hypothetical protein RIB60_11115 [Phycisphaerales bacterium]
MTPDKKPEHAKQPDKHADKNKGQEPDKKPGGASQPAKPTGAPKR